MIHGLHKKTEGYATDFFNYSNMKKKIPQKKKRKEKMKRRSGDPNGGKWLSWGKGGRGWRWWELTARNRREMRARREEQI